MRLKRKICLGLVGVLLALHCSSWIPVIQTFAAEDIMSKLFTSNAEDPSCWGISLENTPPVIKDGSFEHVSSISNLDFSSSTTSFQVSMDISQLDTASETIDSDLYLSDMDLMVDAFLDDHVDNLDEIYSSDSTKFNANEITRVICDLVYERKALIYGSHMASLDWVDVGDAGTKIELIKKGIGTLVKIKKSNGIDVKPEADDLETLPFYDENNTYRKINIDKTVHPADSGQVYIVEEYVCDQTHKFYMFVFGYNVDNGTDDCIFTTVLESDNPMLPISDIANDANVDEEEFLQTILASLSSFSMAEENFTTENGLLTEEAKNYIKEVNNTLSKYFKFYIVEGTDADNAVMQIIPVLKVNSVFLPKTFSTELSEVGRYKSSGTDDSEYSKDFPASCFAGKHENVGAVDYTIDCTPDWVDNPSGSTPVGLVPDNKNGGTMDAIVDIMNEIISNIAFQHVKASDESSSPSPADLAFLDSSYYGETTPIYLYYAAYSTALTERLQDCRTALESANLAMEIEKVGDNGILKGSTSVEHVCSFYIHGWMYSTVKSEGIKAAPIYDAVMSLPYILTECRDPNNGAKKVALVLNKFTDANTNNVTLASKHEKDYTAYTFRDLSLELSSLERMLLDTSIKVELTRLRYNLATVGNSSIKVYDGSTPLGCGNWTALPISEDAIKLFDDSFSQAGQQGTISGSAMADYLKGIIERVDDDVATAVNTPLGWMQYCKEFGLYTFYQGLYGESSQSDSADLTSSLYLYSRGLEAYKNLSWGEDIDKIIYTEWGFLPRKIGSIGDGDSYKMFKNAANDVGWFNFVYALHYTALCFDIANNMGEDTYTVGAISTQYEEATEVTKGYSAKKMREILESSERSSDYDKETFNSSDCNPQVAPGMIRAVIGLHELMTTLGIEKDQWTESIAEYYDLYDLCIRYANNSLVTGSVPAQKTPEEPLGMFFSCIQSEMTDYWNEGVALSTQYVPFETNLYDANSVTFLDDSKWISDFYYKYGFYRKALYINTDGDALINEMTAGTKSATRVATLNDLVNYKGDVILYPDDNFYNALKLQELLNNIDYTTVRAESAGYTKDAEGKEIKSSAGDVLSKGVGQLLDIDAETLLKTASAKYYNERVAKNCAKLDTNEEGSLSTFIYDAYLLSKDDIMGTEDVPSALEYSEYSIKQPFAVVSSIYKNTTLYNTTLQSLVSDTAIFKASEAACGVTSMNTDYYKYYYNFLLLNGLEDAMKNTTDGQLDLSSPIFCDIFGNIITETGYVVIPAAANATLMGENWSPVSLAFGKLVGNQQIDLSAATEDFKEWFTGVKTVVKSNGSLDPTAPEVYNSYTDKSTKYVDHADASGYFCQGAKGFMLNNMTVSAGNEVCTINWQSMPTNSKQFKRLAYSKCLEDITITSLFGPKVVNLVIETLRGAPIEFIDYKVEGLEDARAINNMGVFIAYKLESILQSLQEASNGTSVLNYPDLMFMDGVEYIILYLYKIMFALGILWLAVQIYMDAISHRIGWSSAFKMVVTIVCVLGAVLYIPKVTSWSYYGANKMLLSDEMGYLQILNYAKDFDGSEIGITELKDPETDTNLLIKIDDVEVPWFEMVTKVLSASTTKTIKELYNDHASLNTIANQPNVVVRGNAVYYPVEQLLNDCEVHYSAAGSNLVIRKYTTDGDVMSFISPYYVILEKLVSNINYYNALHNIQSVSVGIAGGKNAGHILTYDVVSAYLQSDEFLAEGYDLFELHQVLKSNSGEVQYGTRVFSEDDVTKMTTALWYPGHLSEDTIRQKVLDLELYARNWVADNEDLFGKVPDEVLVKCFALQLAIEFNDSFGVPYGNSLELIEVDSRDIMRLMLSDRETCYKYFSNNLARFTFEIGGAFGCILLAIYACIAWVINYGKILIMVALIGLLIVNVLLRGVLFPSEESKAIEGYITTAALITLCNYIYAFFLKLLMGLGKMDAGVVLIIFLAIIIQCLYIGAMMGVVIHVIKDWKNIGYESYGNAVVGITQAVYNFKDTVRSMTSSAANTNYVRTRENPNPSYSPDGMTLEDMHRRDAERAMKGREPDGPDSRSSRPNRQQFRR